MKYNDEKIHHIGIKDYSKGFDKKMWQIHYCVCDEASDSQPLDHDGLH